MYGDNILFNTNQLEGDLTIEFYNDQNSLFDLITLSAIHLNQFK